jgi:hypothetical protein
VSETKELKTCYEAKKRSCSTCCTTSKCTTRSLLEKCAPPCRVLHFSWDAEGVSRLQRSRHSAWLELVIKLREEDE